ncbi:MAG: fibronectin type III domain-containing protein [Jatrophihabitantaceae bacterium]
MTLHSSDYGSVSGVAAIGAAALRPDGSGGDAVAVASADSLRIFEPDGSARTAPVRAAPGVDAILAASNQQGRFDFLYHAPSGWSLVSSAADGSGPPRITALRDIDASAQLAVPAQSSGRIYTLDTDGAGTLWQIAADGTAAPVRDASSYPILQGERPDLSSAAVVARGPRVIVNSRANLEAVAIFSDGSHSPVIIDKRTAVDLNANGDATALTLGHQAKAPAQKAQAKKAAPQPAQQVNDKVNCSTTTQIPHVPSVQLLSRGSRSVQLQWTYPLLDRQDCAPSTYTVTVQLVGSNAPAPPSMLTVQGQDGVNVAGLYPDTEYRIVVTAYLDGKGTASAPLPVRTSVEGPGAPTNVRTTVDDAGNWHLSWNSCGGVQQGCVPASSWTVVPRFCDGTGLSSAPATASVVGDPTQHSFSYTYPGGDALLGRGMSFQVEGVGVSGTIGTPAGDRGCAYSWAPPVAAAMTLSASSPPATSVQATTSTTVSMSFIGSQNRATGGAGGQFTYQLLSGGSVVTSSGPTTATTTKLAGLRPGQQYLVAAKVSPPHHPEAAVTIGPVKVTPAIANWPALSVSTSVRDSGPVSATLSVQLGGLSSRDARGETFDLANSTLSCGQTVFDLTATGIDPAQPLTFPVDRLRYYGSCSVRVGLVQNQRTRTDPPYFGAAASGVVSGGVTIDAPVVGTSGGDFHAAWVQGSRTPAVTVSYGGADPTRLLWTGWSTTASFDGGATGCGSSGQNLVSQPATIVVPRQPASCIQNLAGAGWVATVHFTFLGTAKVYPVAVSGSAPAPLDPGKMQFTADWTQHVGANGDPRLRVRNAGQYDDATLATLQWSETVASSASPGAVCATSSQPPTQSGLPIDVDVTKCPTATAPGAPPTVWTVTLAYTDPNTGAQHAFAPQTIAGTPP